MITTELKKRWVKQTTGIVLFLLFLSLHMIFNGMVTMAFGQFYAAFFLITLLFVLRKQKCNAWQNDWGSKVTTLIFFSLLLRFVLQSNPYGSPQIYITLACWLLFFVFIRFFSVYGYTVFPTFGLLLAPLLIELLWGGMQLLGWVGNNNAHFLLGGSFGNPGAFAAYLAVMSPMLLSMLLAYERNKKTEAWYYLLAGCFLLTLYFLVISRSRGGWIACMAGCAMVLNQRYSLLQKAGAALKTPLRRAAAIAGAALLVSAAAFFLYHFKADSAFGRLLVWKVIVATPHENWLWGNGTGYVEANYGKWQSAYFAEQGGTEAERFVADYVTCAYNDFIEIALEQGLIVLCLFALLFFFALKRKSSGSSLVLGAKASLVALLLLMCVSYPFKIAAIYLYFIFCLAIVFYSPEKEKKLPEKVSALANTAILLLSLLIAVGGIYNLCGYERLKRGQWEALTGRPEKAVETYAKAASILKNNSIYHFYYGSALALVKQYEASAEELRLAVLNSSDPHAFMLLGNSCKELGLNDEAEKAYLAVANMQPSRLYPKYLLFKLYIDTQAFEEAKVWANKILATKEKVPTTAAKEIKEEVEQFLHSPNIWQLGKNNFDR